MSPGLVAWFTGLPSSGKSTLAERVAPRLEPERAVVLLDGDAVRKALVPAPGYDAEGRAAFYESLARLAALVAGQGVVVLVPATAHRRAFRARARELAPRFVEIFVDTPLEECRRRDTKGLFARLGADSALPGAGLGFEAPEHADVTVTPEEEGKVERVVEAIRAALSPGDVESNSRIPRSC